MAFKEIAPQTLGRSLVLLNQNKQIGLQRKELQ